VVGVSFAVAFVAVIGLFGIQVFNEFPEFGTSVMQRFADAPSLVYLHSGLAETGAPNLVTAVLLDFRAWDTLGEATVLFCAALGAVVILRRNARIKADKEKDETS
jgi:multisubunit Na+/H+ antiporter MnhB subunit